jgi:hypothetical protein
MSNSSQPRWPVLMHYSLWINVPSSFNRSNNAIHQALLDLWGESGNPCTICALLMVPLDTLTVTYSGASAAQPLSNACKNQITQFQDMYDHCNSQTAWSDHNTLISPHPTLTAIAFNIS